MKDAKEKIPAEINNLCKEAILHGIYDDLISLENMFAYEYVPNPEDIQSLYAVILLSGGQSKKELYDHMVLRTGILPDMNIIDAAYKEESQISHANDLACILPVYDIVHVLPDDEIVQTIYRKRLKEEMLLDDYIDPDGDHSVDLEHITEIEEVVAFTHIEPVYDSTVIQEVFNEIVREKAQDQAKLNKIILYAHKHNILPSSLLDIAASLRINSQEEMNLFLSGEGEYITYLLQTPEQSPKLTREIVDGNAILHLHYLEMELLLQAGVNISEYLDKSKHEELFHKLVEIVPDWRDGGYADMFKQGAEIFGYARMWAYSDKANLSRHDALHSMPNIIAMLNVSGLTPEQFYGNILKHIILDDSSYAEGNAHQHFNAIVNSFNFDIASVLQLANEFSDIPSLQILIKSFDSPKAVFNSWNTLKKYVDIAMQLEKKEAFEQLRELKNKGKIQEFQYYETLLFHPDSKVSVSEVIKLMRDPEDFLAGKATHTPDHIHNAKKPSNYLQIRNLDLSAPELRDGLIEGKLDALQAFPPMEITYSIPVIKGNAFHSFYEVMSYALGSRSKGEAGAANNPNALLKRVNQICKEHNINLVDYLNGRVSINDDLQKMMEIPLYDASIGLAKKTVEWQTYVAKICLKSDPHAIIAGNDTAGCDPFGDGKKTVYTFNMNTNQFTIQMVRTEGDKQILKTVAQSTVTKDIDLHRDVPSLIKDLSVQQGKLTDALPVEITYNQTAVLACDNIEVAANYKDVNKKVIIQLIYENFMRDYLKQYAAQANLQADQFIVGCEGYEGGYARTTSWPEVPNTFAPQAPVSYSDKNGEHVKVVKIQETTEIGAKIIHIPETTPLANPEVAIDTKGIELLTYEDTMKAAWLEGKLFADNQALVFGLHAVENALMAKDLNNAIKGRPNLSVKYVNNDGITQVYLIAYEGKLGAGNGGNGDQTDDSEAIIYIEDVAAPKNSLTGGRLMQGFVELYAKNYLERGILMPIIAEARESTSYRLVQRQLQKIGEKLNIDFDLEEGTVNEVMEHNGNAVDFMHSITIRPRRKEQSS